MAISLSPFCRRTLGVIAAAMTAAFAFSGDAMAWGPIWATNTWESKEHCNPQSGLKSGGIIPHGWGVNSANGKYILALQHDGNLVLYRKDSQPWVAKWASGTSGIKISHAIMQWDGNFVLYDFGGNAKWASNTHGNPGSRLVVQCDGNVVIEKP